MSDCKTCGDPAFPNDTYCSKSCAVEEDLRLGRRGQEIPVALEWLPDHEVLDDADVTEGWSTAPPPPNAGYSTRPPPPFHHVPARPWPKMQAVFAEYTEHTPTPPALPKTDYVLPTDSDERKEIPIFSGVLNYFPLAIAAVARVSKKGNDKHNPGQPLHWARGKSMDHPDCIARHLIDIETVHPVSGEYEDAAALAWRALAKLQELEEKRLGKPMSRGSKESV